MDATADARALLAQPIDHYFAARSFVAWVQSPSLLGGFHIGPFDPFDREPATTLFTLPLGPHLAPRFDLLHDLSAIELLEERAFEFFEQFLARFAALIAARVRRLAIVLPDGYVGAAFGGLTARWVAPVFAAFRLCERRAQAYELLELAPERVGVIEALYRDYELPPLLVRLRALLAAEPRTSSLEACARTLSASPRSLQRCLGTRRTSFRRELALARARIACELLLSGEKVETVAREVGFSTGEAFAVSFQQHIGESPARYRDAVMGRTRPG
jgi:AraC-like DNA-binding protein